MLKLKQFKYIELLNSILKSYSDIMGITLIGSFGRNNPSHNSDIDYQVLVNKEFRVEEFIALIDTSLELNYHLYLDEKKKICFYFENFEVVVEIMICTSLEEINKYYLGSEINNIESSVINDTNNLLLSHIKKITNKYNNDYSERQRENILSLIQKFQNSFEACSKEHCNSDGYKQYVLFSHALNALIRIIYLCESNKSEFEYMPKNFLTDYSYKLGLNIESLSTMNLVDVNSQKRALLDLFKKYLAQSINKFNLDIAEDKIFSFLENIYQRDFFWNFRDLSKFNEKIKSNILYRSSALCLVKEEKLLEKELMKKNITTIVDFRADREIEENSYSKEFHSKFNIVHAPFDPWNQSIEFQNTYNTGTNVEIAYKFFSYECKDSIKKVILAIINTTDKVVIHCHAGKDRTGIFATILHLLVDGLEDSIYTDYLASKMDTKVEYIDIFLNIIKESDGIINYLKSCDLSLTEVKKLKNKVSKIC